MSCLPIATQAEAEAGTANDKAMTPLRTKEAINALGVSQTTLASPTGGEMVGTSRDNTVNSELTWVRAAAPASIDEFYDASNGAAAERMALEAALATGRAVSFRGAITLDQVVTMPAGAILIGEGASADDNTAGKTTIIRGFAGSGPLFICGPYSLIRDIDFDGDNQGTGDNIQIVGFRATLQNVSSRKAGRDNYRIGADNDSTVNANCWQLFNVRSYASGRHGLFIHHTRSPTSPEFPQGAPDVNAGSVFGADIVRSGADGLKIGNAIDNKFFGVTIQESKLRNIHLDTNAQGHVFVGPYSEAGGDLDLFAAGTKRNVYAWNRSNVVSSGLTDSGTGNMVIGSNSNMVPDQFGFMERLSIYGAMFPSLDLYGEGSLYAQIQSRSSGVGTGGMGVATAKRPGDSPIDIFRWLNTGIDALAGDFLHRGTKVVGARDTGWSAMTGTGSKAALAAAAAGTVSAAYVQAEAQASRDRIAALEARLKSYDAALVAHGLIGA